MGSGGGRRSTYSHVRRAAKDICKPLKAREDTGFPGMNWHQ